MISNKYFSMKEQTEYQLSAMVVDGKRVVVYYQGWLFLGFYFGNESGIRMIF